MQERARGVAGVCARAPIKSIKSGWGAGEDSFPKEVVFRLRSKE